MTIPWLEWQAPAPAAWEAWRAEAEALLAGGVADAEAGARLAEMAHRMASVSLDPVQQLRLERLARRMVPHAARVAPLRPLRIGVVADQTLDFLLPTLQAAGLGRLLLVEPQLAPLGSAAAIAHGGLRPFEGDLDLILWWHDALGGFAATPLLDSLAEDQAVAAATARLSQTIEGLRQAYGADVMVTTTAPPARISSLDPVTDGAAGR
ncbi:MAG: hypothetical protein AAGI70_03135, partial [Pseudomonadota bacterium]